jgi:ubiquinone/menaquinone biosynthesis C-methylase UbiE
MFSKTAAWYDAVYAEKDYAGEARRVAEIIGRQEPRKTLLDVACGTGSHLVHFAQSFQAEGLDLDGDLLAIARRRLAHVVFHQGDMCDFNLGCTFDAITCLFSSIGYAGTHERLKSALACFARHLKPGGILVLEPWLQRGQFAAGYVSLEAIERDDLKIARMQRSTIEDGKSVLNFGYLVGTSESIDHFTERHELGLFAHEVLIAELKDVGFDVSYDAQGLMGRGLYVATKSG